jgi:hypothetical protein
MSDEQPASSFWRSRSGIAFGVLAAVAAAFLALEHRAHVLGALPYLLVLACPLMHLFHHRGHGQHRHRDHEGQR